MQGAHAGTFGAERVYPGMKRNMICLALVAITLSCASAQSTTSNLGRESYLDRASQQLRQLRSQIDSVGRQSSSTAQSRFGPLYDAVASAERALADLRTASTLDQEARQADFERAKSQAVQLWNDFRISSTRLAEDVEDTEP